MKDLKRKWITSYRMVDPIITTEIVVLILISHKLIMEKMEVLNKS